MKASCKHFCALTHSVPSHGTVLLGSDGFEMGFKNSHLGKTVQLMTYLKKIFPEDNTVLNK